MKKFICFLMAAVLIFAGMPLVSFAINQPANINTPLVMPDLYCRDDGSFINFQYVITSYRQDAARAIIINGRFVTGGVISFRAVDYNYTYLISTSNAVDGQFEEYDLYTGALVSQGNCYIDYSDNRIYVSSTNRWPSRTDMAQHTYLPDNITRSNYNYNGVNEFVIWSVVPPDPIVYRSYMSEPKADPLNKYVILAGPDGQYLFWINIRCRDFEMLSYSWDIETDDPNVSDFVTYNEVIKAESLFTPTLKFIASGQSILSIECNQQLLDWYFQLPSLQSTTTGFIAFECLITKYELQTGQFISSSYNNNCVMQSQYIDIDATSFFGSASDYDSIAVYGLNYYNQSDVLINRLSCVWSVDPLFETWQHNMLNYVHLIWEILNEQVDTSDVTIANDTDAFEDVKQAQEALKMTDANGQEIKPAQAAGAGFSEAASAMGNLAAPVSTINSVITDWVFGINPLIYLPLIVGLALGLLVTILGKNKSD